MGTRSFRVASRLLLAALLWVPGGLAQATDQRVVLGGGTPDGGSPEGGSCTAQDGEEALLEMDTLTEAMMVEVCSEITVRNNFTVTGPGGDLSLHAGRAVILGDGFSLTFGGRMTAEIDPSLASDRPADWSSSFVWVNHLDTDEGSIWPSDGWGTACDASERGDIPPTLDTTNYAEGSASTAIADGVTEDSYLEIDWTDGGCEEARVGGDISTGCWVRRTTCSSSNCPRNEVVTSASNHGSGGWNLMVRGVGGCIGVDHCGRCYTDGIALAETSTEITDGWWHIQMAVDDTAGECTIYLNGVSDTVQVGTNAVRSVPTNQGSVHMGDRTRSVAEGNLDECYQFNGELSERSAKRIWACGIDGELCTCDGASYTDCGRAEPDCTGLPDCSALAPD